MVTDSAGNVSATPPVDPAHTWVNRLYAGELFISWYDC